MFITGGWGDLLVAPLLSEVTDGETAACPSTLLVPEAVIDVTLKLLASFGNGRHEGVVYWAGQVSRDRTIVLHAIAPDAETGPGFFRTSVEANAAVITQACSLNLELVAQVHSHPRGWVDHSDGDNQMALKPFAGSYSIVVPSYGGGSRHPEAWGVYCWDGHRFLSRSGDTIAILPVASDLRTSSRRLINRRFLSRIFHRLRLR
jgi:hypothetical protein